MRATVLTGGGLRLKGLVPKLRSRRVQMIFPLAGSERRGLVSLEAKKLKASVSLGAKVQMYLVYLKYWTLSYAPNGLP